MIDFRKKPENVIPATSSYQEIRIRLFIPVDTKLNEADLAADSYVLESISQFITENYGKHSEVLTTCEKPNHGDFFVQGELQALAVWTWNLEEEVLDDEQVADYTGLYSESGICEAMDDSEDNQELDSDIYDVDREEC